MLAAYFGFDSEPFGDSTGSAFVASNLFLRGVAAQLLAGVAERKGLMLIYGEPSSGRKLLLGHVAGELRGHCRTVSVECAPHGSFDDILARCCAELGVAEKTGERLQRARALVNHLIAQLPDGRTTVLLVDEAQNLDGDGLRNLFLLSELGERRAVQVVLAGRPDLEGRFADPDLAAVLRGAGPSCRLPSLRASDYRTYIETQLERVAAPDRALFTAEAIERVAMLLHKAAQLVDRLCTQALVIARLQGSREVSAEAVEQAAQAVLTPAQKSEPAAEAPPAAVRVLPAPTPAPQVHEPRPVFARPAEAASKRGDSPRKRPDPLPRRIEPPKPLPEAPAPRRAGRLALAALTLGVLLVLGGSAWMLKDQLGRVGVAAPVPAPAAAREDLSNTGESLARIAPATGADAERPLEDSALAAVAVRTDRLPPSAGTATSLVAARSAAQETQSVVPAAEPAVLPVATPTPPIVAIDTVPDRAPVLAVSAEPAGKPAPAVALTNPVEAAPKTPEPSAAPAELGAAEQQFMSRGSELLLTGDFAGARLFFERAAVSGNARAITAVGKTYDPTFHAEAGFPQSPGDAGRAAEWYRRGAEAGDAEAAMRLNRLRDARKTPQR
jgi:type II secretory pathway predicted ATPase ExeA